VARVPHPADRRLPTTALAVLLGTGLGLGAGVAAVTGTAVSASAHDRLESTDPADGATLPAAPDHVALVMSSDPLGLGTQVQVTGPAGVVSTGSTAVVDNTVTQALAADRPAGTYTVQWRITSSDGHPVSGSFAFTATAATGTPSPSATGSSTATGSAPAAAPSPSSPAADPLGATGSSSPLLAAGVVALAVLAVVGIVLGARRRRGGS